MKSNKFKFTKTALKNITLPNKGKRISYYDEATPTLMILVSSTGTKTFYVYRKVIGKPERIKLGNFPTMTCEQARKECALVNGMIVDGVNPNQIKRQDRQELSLEGLFSEYMERHAKPRKITWDQDQYNFDSYVEKLHARKLSKIQRNDIERLHNKIGKESGVYTANRVLSLLKKVFNCGIDWGEFSSVNPCIGISLFKEESRDRFLQADEVLSFFRALSEENSETLRDYVMISLLTGARRSNVLAMRWDQISFARADWRIPSTKNDESLVVPLGEEAIQVLRQRAVLCKGNEWVFPGTGESGHFVSPQKGWTKMLVRAGLKDLRIHDLRRTMGSWQTKMGASLPIVGKTLGHKSVSTTAIYARLDIDPVRNSMEMATQAILRASKPSMNGSL